jgi:WD40 repeat protein
MRKIRMWLTRVLTSHSRTADEFFAHTDTVNCARLGHRSGQIIVTGADDHLAHVWRISTSKALLTLRGHNAPVDVIAVAATEQNAITASRDGNIRVWDIDNGGGRVAIIPHQF